MSKKYWYAPHKKEAYGKEEIDAVIDCLNDGWLAGFGPKTIEFERKISELFGKKYGLFVNSGSSAILLALLSLNLEKDTEIITPACTFATTVAPIIQSGLKPVFCDVELGSFVPSLEQILERVTDNTKVILLPNLIGSKPDWKKIRESINKDIILIEDSADTITYTLESDISTTSFYSSHLITAAGSGGMVMFNNESYLKRALMFRDWGRIGDNSEDMATRYEYKVDNIPYDYKFLYGVIGYNFKSSEINAAFGLAQLNRIEDIIKLRSKIFNRYLENLRDVSQITLPINKENINWLAIPLMSKDRLNLLKFLEDNNIQTRVCFSGNITRHPAYREYLNTFTNSDQIMSEGFLLGAHHGMEISDVDYICDKIKEYFQV
jgi:CDP-6-deoxy-D-xylo-4-hexulose-3-dehydrase